jgi:hypothetical protein
MPFSLLLCGENSSGICYQTFINVQILVGYLERFYKCVAFLIILTFFQYISEIQSVDIMEIPLASDQTLSVPSLARRDKLRAPSEEAI